MADILEEHGLTNAKSASTPGSNALKAEPRCGVSAITSEETSNHRGGVGTLIWLIPMRPDINYATKELSRSLVGT